MMFPDPIRLLYLICSTIAVILLGIECIRFYKKVFRSKYHVLNIIVIGIISIIFYSLFLVSSDEKLAMFFESLFFIGTDWLAMFMFFFSMSYTEYESKIPFTKILFSFFVIADTVSLILNNFRFHMFKLIPLTGGFGIGNYWGNEFYFFHYCHLAICYVMVLSCVACLLVGIVKANKIYKQKYYTVLISYVIVIIANYISYSLNLPIDISVVLYGVLGGFITYHTVIGFPKKYLHAALLMVNDTISDAVIYFDYFGKCVYANRSAKQLFSNDGEFLPELTETYRERWSDQLCSNERSITGTDSFYDDGKETFYEVVYQREYSKDSEVGSSLKFFDKTDEVLRFESERKLAIHDSLTGIYNRIGFFEAVDALVEKYGSKGWLLLSSNIKDFKLINEYFGEQRGDEVLKRQAIICQTNSHGETVYGRINDDKLALYTRKEYFDEKLFMKFIAQMAELTDCPYYKMKVAVGIYSPDGKDEKAQTMYDKALLASEYSNDEYDKVFAYYDSQLMGKIFNDKRLSDSLDEAIANKEIEMYLQPIINKKGKCVGAEALSRWRSLHFGDMMPSQFISILEKSGKIYLLDNYIWEQTGKLLQKWNEEGKKDFYITVNISIKDFFYTDLYATFKELIKKYSFDPKCLRVEITETVLMTDFTKVFTLAEQLRAEGICVAIDNFGNGYSSLNMLKDFKADIIKIDMALLKNAATEERSQIILDSIIGMTKELGMASVGSGVETKEQYEVLKKCHCEYFQGNYLSQPISVNEFEIKYNS